MDSPAADDMPVPPTGPPPRRSPLRWMVFLGVLAFVLMVFMVMAKFGQLKQAREKQEARLDSIIDEMNRPRPSTPASPVDEVQRLKDRIQKLEEENRRLRSDQAANSAASGAAPSGPEPLPQIRTSDPELEKRLEAGIRELRGGRIAEAEAHLFRAAPRSTPYLLLSSLIRGDYGEAVTFLSRSAQRDPLWYRKVAPRSVFGSEEAYLRVLAALEAHVRENPLDAEAKTLLAFLYYHEKGANFAKALLVEATTADPKLEGARNFLESLDK